jgi:regulatory protein
MPLITALEPTSRRLGGALLEVDDVPLCRVTDELRLRYGLAVGACLSREQVEALEQEAGAAEAMARALHYLSYRPRTNREVRSYLRKHGLEACADLAISRCAELGYLDDEAYAVSFVRDRIRLGPRGKPRLVSELLARGVDREIAEKAVGVALTDEDVTEEELLRRVALRRLRSLRSVEPEVARRRLASFLGRRGFRTGAIRDLVRELLPDEPHREGP